MTPHCTFAAAVILVFCIAASAFAAPATRPHTPRSLLQTLCESVTFTPGFSCQHSEETRAEKLSIVAVPCNSARTCAHMRSQHLHGDGAQFAFMQHKSSVGRLSLGSEDFVNLQSAPLQQFANNFISIRIIATAIANTTTAIITTITCKLTTAARCYIVSSTPSDDTSLDLFTACAPPTPPPPPPGPKCCAHPCSLPALIYVCFSSAASNHETTIPSLPSWYPNHAIRFEHSVTARAFSKSAFKFSLANGLSVTVPPSPVFTAGATAPQVYRFTCGACVEDKVHVVLTWSDPSGNPIFTMSHPKNNYLFMFISVGTRSNEVDKNVIQTEPMFQFPVITSLLVFVCSVIVNLWHHVRDFALVGIPMFAACSAMKALLGSLIAGRCHRKCAASSRQCVVVSSGMQRIFLCTRKLVTLYACTCDNYIQTLRCTCQGHLKKYAAHFSACAASSAALSPVNPSRKTLPSLIERVSTTARTNPCALFGLEWPAVAVMLTMSLLLFPITAAQTCANPKLGQARWGLAAASLPSGLVFFAGGMPGTGSSVHVWQL